MKKRILLFTAIAGMAFAILTSGNNGARAQKKDMIVPVQKQA